MPDIIVVTESLRKAKQLKKESGIPHHEALEIVARKGGVFANWHQVVEAAKATEPSERVGEMLGRIADIELGALAQTERDGKSSKCYQKRQALCRSEKLHKQETRDPPNERVSSLGKCRGLK